MDTKRTRLRLSRFQLQQDVTRSAATQPYRATQAAQAIARTYTVIDNGRTVTVRPLADVLSPKTRATLAALARRDGGRNVR